jgi:hypothetical protein
MLSVGKGEKEKASGPEGATMRSQQMSTMVDRVPVWSLQGFEGTGSKMKPRVGQYSARPCLSLLFFHTDSHRFW